MHFDDTQDKSNYHKVGGKKGIRKFKLIKNSEGEEYFELIMPKWKPPTRFYQIKATTKKTYFGMGKDKTEIIEDGYATCTPWE